MFVIQTQFINSSDNDDNDDDDDEEDVVDKMEIPSKMCYILVILFVHFSFTESVSDEQIARLTSTKRYITGDDDTMANPLRRVKRTMVKGNNRYYKYGIVPYVFDPALSDRDRRIIRNVMERYENMTCIRFVPRTLPNGQWAKDVYNLGHRGYLKFIWRNACFGGIGNNDRDTLVSCCEWDSCIHEIGHTLGQLHEHQNPNSEGVIRINDRYISDVEKVRYIQSLPSEVMGNFPFDISSYMNYPLGGAGDKIQLLTRDISKAENDFYMFHEISVAHRCQENNCSYFQTECLNDGYVTLIHGSCQCRCPEGLNPDTGCRTTLSQHRADGNCGGTFDLTDDNPTVTFTKPRNLMSKCTWLINAPEGDTIKLDFEEFNITKRSNACQDKIKIRHNRIGQGSRTFCGTVAPKKIKSYFNHIVITFVPATSSTARSYFNATAKLISARTLCYNPRDKGYTYDGTVNYARDYTRCLPWWKVAHCPHNPYNFQDLESNVNLNNNYCRNPGNGLQPWCYTWAPNCQRKYCDVCNLDKPEEDKGFRCNMGTRYFNPCRYDPQDARKSCATTCASYLFPPQPSALTVTCPLPPSLLDSEQIDKLDQSSFSVGDFVTYQCRHDDHMFRTEMKKYCLTSGRWSVGNTACLPCHLHKGYVLYNNSCYAVQTQRKTASQHQRECELYGGTLADVKTMDEQKYITNLAFSKKVANLFIGPNDIRQEGTFRYRSDNLPVIWTNWYRRNMNRRNTDCVWTNLMNKWVHGRCSSKLQAVCKGPMLRHPRRRLVGCSDSRDDCQQLLDTDGQMCHRGGGSFGVSHCPLTCGKCI